MKSAFLHPLLFAVFPILFLFSHNAKSLSVNNIFIPLVIVIPFTLLIFFIVTLIFRNLQKAGIIVSLFMLLFFSFGHFISVLGYTDISIFGIVFGRVKITALIWIIILLPTFFILLRSDKTFNKLTCFINLFAILLIGFQLVSGAYTLMVRNQSKKISHEIKLNKYDILPDIYHIILDGYGRADILQEIYNYDNSEFIALLSMFSTYNMNYLNTNDVPVDSRSTDRLLFANRLWNNNIVINPLANQLGYSTVSFSSGYSLLVQEHFDAFIAQNIRFNEYHNTLLNLTPFHLFMKKSPLQYKSHRNQIIFTLEKIPDIIEMKSPKFVYAHIIAPHPPFVFDERGELNAPNRKFTLSDGSHFFEKGGTAEEYLQGYSNSLASVNKLIKTTISRLKANSERPFIIIVQGDHGPGLGLNWKSVENTNIKERFSILNAYYFYDQNYSSLYPQITPVNTFRVIFNQYFGTDYDLLADRSYYSTWDQPFKLIRIPGTPSG